VVEETVLVRHLIEVELERRDDLLLQAVCWRIPATVCDAQSREAEACGSNARDKAVIKFASGVLVRSAIEYLPCRGVRLLHEIEAGSVLQVLKEVKIKIGQQPR